MNTTGEVRADNSRSVFGRHGCVGVCGPMREVKSRLRLGASMDNSLHIFAGMLLKFELGSCFFLFFLLSVVFFFKLVCFVGGGLAGLHKHPLN